MEGIGMMVNKYRVWVLDAWEDGEDGWTVNDRNCLCTVKVRFRDDRTFDTAFRRMLGRDWLKPRVRVDLDFDCWPDVYVYSKAGQPYYQFEGIGLDEDDIDNRDAL
jgi:hypothetical protein